MSTILVLVENPGNRQVLVDELSRWHDVVIASSAADLERPYDVAVVDGVSLDRLWETIVKRKQVEQPLVLPFLLIASRRDVGMATRHLWRTIDELILSPIDHVELQARIAALLRLRYQTSETYAAMVGAIPLGVVCLDAEQRVQRWNAAAERILGWGEAEVLGHPIPILSSGADATTDTLLRRIAEGDSLVGEEVRTVRKDGVAVVIELYSAPLRDQSGRITSTVLMMSDATQRKRMEAELLVHQTHLERIVEERTAELAEANRSLHAAIEAKALLLRSMSHDLRTPLNSVIGFSDLLQSGLAGDLNDEQRRQVDMIARAGRHLLSIVDDILKLSRLEAGRLEVSWESFDVIALAQEALHAVAPAASAKGLDLSLDAPEEASIEMVSDRTKVLEILLNLLGNAVSYTEAGSVSVSVQERAGHLIAIAVSDTGPGIPDEEQERIFEEFARGSSRASQIGGTGLGLPIARRLATLLGGELTLESTVGRGSTFRLTLPKAPPPTNEAD